MTGVLRVWLGNLLPLLAFLAAAGPVSGQVIEFWANGLKYQALTRSGLTVMYARMPLAVRGFSIIQVALNNGSNEVWKVEPTDFFFEQSGGQVRRAVSENAVIADLFRNADTDDVIKLQTAYEKAIYGNQHIRSNNGYEQRRQYAMAMGPRGLKAAAAASAIAFVPSKLKPGDSTDGAVFFASQGKAPGPGKLILRLDEATFEFEPEQAEPTESSRQKGAAGQAAGRTVSGGDAPR